MNFCFDHEIKYARTIFLQIGNYIHIILQRRNQVAFKPLNKNSELYLKKFILKTVYNGINWSSLFWQCRKFTAFFDNCFLYQIPIVIHQFDMHNSFRKDHQCVNFHIQRYLLTSLEKAKHSSFYEKLFIKLFICAHSCFV